MRTGRWRSSLFWSHCMRAMRAGRAMRDFWERFSNACALIQGDRMIVRLFLQVVEWERGERWERWEIFENASRTPVRDKPVDTNGERLDVNFWSTLYGNCALKILSLLSPLSSISLNDLYKRTAFPSLIKWPIQTHKRPYLSLLQVIEWERWERGERRGIFEGASRTPVR